MATNETKYLECHAYRHDWDEVSVMKEPSFGVALDYRCTLCHGIKRVIVSRNNGQVLSRYYKMERDYRGPVGMTRADYRKEWINKKLKNQRKLRAV